MVFGQPKEAQTQTLFCGITISEVSSADIALEAINHLGLLQASAVNTIAEMIDFSSTEHPRAITTRYRKSGEQISPELKRSLGVRSNGFMSHTAYSELTDRGRERAIEAHEVTLLRAVFHKTKINTLSQCAQVGFLEVRFSPSHLSECGFCQKNEDCIMAISDLKELPFRECSREACSALLMPHRDYLAEPVIK